jgi:hypothetical protein
MHAVVGSIWLANATGILDILFLAPRLVRVLLLVPLMILLHVLLLILRHRNGSLSPAGSMHTQSLKTKFFISSGPGYSGYLVCDGSFSFVWYTASKPTHPHPTRFNLWCTQLHLHLKRHETLYHNVLHVAVGCSTRHWPRSVCAPHLRERIRTLHWTQCMPDSWYMRVVDSHSGAMRLLKTNTESMWGVACSGGESDARTKEKLSYIYI